MDGEQRVQELEVQLARVAKRNEQIKMAQFVVNRMTLFVKANPLTMDATPQLVRSFLADLCKELVERCHGT